MHLLLQFTCVIISNLFVYQCDKLVLVFMHLNLMHQSVKKEVKCPRRHQLAVVQCSAVIHEW